MAAKHNQEGNNDINIRERERTISDLREQLRYREQEKDRVWESYWFICWIFLPLVGWIIIIITIITKMNKSSRLERECNELREEIRDLEREIREERYNKQYKKIVKNNYGVED